MGKGAPRFLAQCQPLEVAPSIFNPLGVMGRTSWVLGQGDTVGQTPTGTGASSYPPTHHCVPNPRKCGAELGARRHPGGGGGDEPEKDPLYGPPLFLEVAHNFKFPPPRLLVSICRGWGRRAAPPPPDSRARPSPPLLPALSAHFWRCKAPRDLFDSHF